MPKYEFHIFITRCKSYRCPKSIHYVSHENERVILLVFQLLYLNNELTDPIFLFPFLKEHRCRLHYILLFSWVNYFKFGISHQRTTLISLLTVLLKYFWPYTCAQGWIKDRARIGQ